MTFVAAGKTLYLRGLPEDLVREAKATAARRGLTLAALVTEALRQVVGGKPAGPPRRAGGARAGRRGGDGEAAWGLAESMRWFEAHRARLLRRYRDQYVAILDGRVIDHDRDFDALARRVFSRVGARPVCMPKVTPAERVVRVPSPRVAGS